MTPRTCLVHVSILLSLLPHPIMAEPIVLHDAGIGVDLPDYTQTRKRIQEHNGVPPEKHPKGHLKTEHEFDIHFPFSVDGMSLSLIDAYPNHMPSLHHPVCVIGSDDKSLAWLHTYHDQLRALRATCLLVEASSIDALSRVATYSRDIPVMPDLEGLSRTLFNLSHYPVLVSSHWIEQ